MRFGGITVLVFQKGRTQYQFQTVDIPSTFCSFTSCSNQGSSMAASEVTSCGHLIKVGVVFSCSILSIVLGSWMLVFWYTRLRQARSQQWLIPVGLILFGTPTLILISFLASEPLPPLPTTLPRNKHQVEPWPVPSPDQPAGHCDATP
ncbi:uncharacterized protein LOC116261690 [Nymphaea colorata]|uniref:uncharacterized protein LOC116261690 n=1 Tax=Nymphaea colorata TaxID=210225 RepID=UPI00129D3897|nr:uncharacterized protein LOC116261690 [Nymphaea colorata]